MTKLGIVCAVEREAKPFLDALRVTPGTEKTVLAKMTFHAGELFGKSVVVVHCGVAKVNAAIAVGHLVRDFACDFVVLSGTAGALVPGLEIGQCIVPSAVHYHDVDDINMRDSFPHVPNAAFIPHAGFVATAKSLGFDTGAFACGEHFINGERRTEIARRLGCVAVDMESAAVGQVCYVYDVPFAVVKTITDNFENDTTDDFERNVVDASNVSFRVLERIIRSGPLH